MELLLPSIGLIFWTTVVFLILLVLLRKFAWNPILNSVNQRELFIEDALNQAKKAKEEMAYLKTENEKIMNQARAERDEMLKEARLMKERTVASAKDLAKEEADKIVAQARETIQNEKSAALTEVKNQMALMSINMAEKVLHKELEDRESQESYVNRLIQDINLS